MHLSRRATTIPVPLNVLPAQKFLGNDGQWSTFQISVGTPAQNFYVLPATLQSDIWVPVPEGCTPNDPPDCQTRRGGTSFKGQPPAGFLTNQSSTWNEIGLFSINSENVLGFWNENGLYGNDTVSIGTNATAAQVIVGGIATKDFFLGSLGLSIRPTTFTSTMQPARSFLQHLFDEKLIPSLSYSYTTGASYVTDGTYSWGSLVLGGYDTTKFKPQSSISIPFNSNQDRLLTVGIPSIIGTNVANGTASFTNSNTFTAVIDSTITQMYLPKSVCDQFQQNLNLSYQNQSNFYLISSTTRASLLSRNPSFTFVIGQNSSVNGESVSITFPYSAFDAQISWPLTDTVNASYAYFPIRQAANDSQNTLGRVFLQQAHLTVDYTSENFSISQVNFPDTTTLPHLVAIDPNSGNSRSDSGSNTLGGGAIAGIVIGSIVGLALIAAIVYFFFWRPRRRMDAHNKAAELHGDGLKKVESENKDIPGLHEADDTHINEMSAETGNKDDELAELGTTEPQPIYEMDGSNEVVPNENRTLTPKSDSATSRTGSAPFSPVSGIFSDGSNSLAQPSPMRSQHSPSSNLSPAPPDENSLGSHANSQPSPLRSQHTPSSNDSSISRSSPTAEQHHDTRDIV